MPHSEKPSDKPLLSHEQWESVSRYAPHPRVTFSNPQDIAKALLSNAGRFRSPLSFREKLQLKVFSLSLPLDFFNLSQNFLFKTPSSFIPYPWQVLLRYLQREGLMERASAEFIGLAHDAPRMRGILLKGKNNSNGYGVSQDPEVALSKAIGELLERSFLTTGNNYCFSSVESLRSQKKRFLDPKILSQFSVEQKENFSRLEFHEEKPLYWVKANNLLDKKVYLLPSQVVYRDHKHASGEGILRDPNTNGCAGGFTKMEAVLGAIYENVERDSFFIYWLNSIVPSKIRPDTIPNLELQTLIAELRRDHFEVYFLNITTDIGIPSFISVLIDQSKKGPRITMGGGCGFDPGTVLLSATREALVVYSTSHSRTSSLSITDGYIPFSSAKINHHTRTLLWLDPQMFTKIEPFLSGPEQDLEMAFPTGVKFLNTEQEYNHVLDIFRKLGAGYEIYVYNVKNRILETIGYHVVKVVIPELVHLYLNEALPPFGMKRLKEVPEKIGRKAADSWNPWPHPFP